MTRVENTLWSVHVTYMTAKLLDRAVLTKKSLVDPAVVVDVFVGVFLRDRTSRAERTKKLN